MDIFTSLNANRNYSSNELQLILGGWVLSGALGGGNNGKVNADDGHVSEDDYDKQSIYALLYSLYRAIGVVKSETGSPYEFTFNTWGYAWPEAWGEAPISESDPQRFGKNAYSGLFHFDAVKKYARERKGHVHVVEMGCGTGAGAHHVCTHVLPKATYEAVDMQVAGIQTCRRKFVPELGGRLVGTCADATDLPIQNEVADFVTVCETHVTEMPGVVCAEDKAFFGSAHRVLKPGGYVLWGNAIPDTTWEPTFEYLSTIGFKVQEVCDVTKEAVEARDLDERRADAYVQQATDKFLAFRIPVLGKRRRAEAEIALKNFFRNPGTDLYNNMRTRKDTYRVVLIQKVE